MRHMSAPSNAIPHNVCLSLGSNVGDRLVHLRAAKAALERYITIEQTSPVYETAAAYITDQPPFFNAALKGRTTLEPQALLFTVKNIERQLGRAPTYRYGPRIIDIDILFYDDLFLSSPELNVPHALMHERIFVLKPLADIAPQWKHPALGKTVASMLADIEDHQSVLACNGPL